MLGGAPGIFSARWSGRHGDDPANLELLLAQLADVPDEHRAAAFVCAAALVLPDGREWVARAASGTITREPRGTGGFGYDPILQPRRRTDHGRADAGGEERDQPPGHAFRALGPTCKEHTGVRTRDHGPARPTAARTGCPVGPCGAGVMAGWPG